jgi:hypothetical protein
MEFRCRRSEWCSTREAIHDPVTGDFLEYQGAPLDSADGLCEICESKVLDALIHLPGDITELTQLIGKPLSGELHEFTSGRKPGPSVPIQVHLEALRSLIDHETTSWAKSTAEADGVAWNSLKMHRSRAEYRVKAACCLLRTHMPVFLGLGKVEHRARSLGIRRGDGHDPEVATRYNDDIWIHRDGLEGAILLLDLHQKAWRIGQHHQTPETIFDPCRRCQNYNVLQRWPGEGLAKCSYCHHEVSLDHIDAIRSALANSKSA